MAMVTPLSAVFSKAAKATQTPLPDGPGQDAGPITVDLQALLRLHGEASTSVVLLLLAVFTVLPIAGVGTVLSFGIFALAWRWARQMETTSLPERLGRITLNAHWTLRCLQSLAWLYGQAERRLKPRWHGVTHARTNAAWALWIGVMGFLIFLPVPFGNILPGLSLVLLSLGWMFRDGLALMVSALLGVAAAIFCASFSQLLWHLLIQMSEQLTQWM
jgi:hypothetical protein